MPSDTPIRVTRTQLAVFGRTLRRHALYSLTRGSVYGRRVALDLWEIAETLDPEPPEDAMSIKGQRINQVIDLLAQAQDALTAAEKEKAALAEELATVRAQVPVEDPEDVAAEARLAAVLAPQAPAEPTEAPASAAPAGVTFDVPTK